MRKRLLIPVALLLLLPAVLAGCGSSNSSPEADWAQNFCDALGTWKASVTQAGKTLADTSNLSKNTAQQAVDSISSANTKLVDDLKALGKPEGSSGPQAKEAVQTLSNQLQQDAKTVKNAMKGVSTTQELLSAIPTMANAASAAATAVSTTISQLESLDTSDKWKQAFEDSDACKSLKNV